MSDFQQTITSLNLLYTSLYRMELFQNAQGVKNVKTDVISLISRLEAAERERDELRAERDGAMESALAVADAWVRRAKDAEAELARRDAASAEPDYWQFKSVNGDWIGIGESGMRQAVSEGVEVRPLYTAAPPAVLPWHVDSCSNCGSKRLSWDTTVIKNTGVQDGRLKLNETSGLFYLGCDECSETLLKVSAEDVANHLNNAK